MDQTAIIENLMMFGLTRQEATIYICLCINKELTGYEVAKLTGISRSNVYGALAGITEKGAAYVIDGSTSKYVAVNPEEFCTNRIRTLNYKKQCIVNNIPQALQQSDGYITIEGYKNIVDKIINMVINSRHRLYISAKSDFILLIKPYLLTALEKNIKIVLVTDRKLNINNTIEYISEKCENQIRLITDSSYVLTGELNGNSSDTCLYSGQKNFVNVFKDALRNEIKLIEIGSKKDEH